MLSIPLLYVQLISLLLEMAFVYKLTGHKKLSFTILDAGCHFILK